ncbi:craniofacial development protein 2-like [Diadema antillarum]|uniref:craniofacial development protein 2-like n=1 Tax=Diadema antillarum TaxID=105358 RepID=UPI003A8BE8EB
MPDRSGPGLTTTRPADSLKGGRDKLTTGVKNTIKLPTKGITVGTWNVRTLHACGKIHELTHELDGYRWDIVGLCEAYAPTSRHDDEEVEEFYDQLEDTIAKVQKNDLMIVQGDWNAKVGPDAYENWAGTVGRFGIGHDRGLRLLKYAKSHCLTLANTLHPHKWSRTVVWHSPNGQVHNQ